MLSKIPTATASICRVMKSLFLDSLLASGAALDALFIFRTLENSVNKNAGSVNLIWVELAEPHEFFNFGDDVIRGRGHHGIKVARSLAIDEIAPAVTLPGFDKREIAAQATLHHVLAAIELASFFSFGNHRAVTRRRVERWNTSTSGAQTLRERALRIQLHLQFAAQDKLLEQFVFADVRGNHFFHLALLEQHADAEIIDTSVIADDGEVLGAFAANGGDQILRNAAETEATHEDDGAVGEVGDGGVGGGDAFVHSVLRGARGVYFIGERTRKTPLPVTRDCDS